MYLRLTSKLRFFCPSLSNVGVITCRVSFDDFLHYVGLLGISVTCRAVGSSGTTEEPFESKCQRTTKLAMLNTL